MGSGVRKMTGVAFGKWEQEEWSKSFLKPKRVEKLPDKKKCARCDRSFEPTVTFRALCARCRHSDLRCSAALDYGFSG